MIQFWLVSTLLFLGGCATVTPPKDKTPEPLPGLPLIYAFTVDDVGNVPAIIAALKSLPKKPYIRVVFDENVKAKDYVSSVTELHKYAFIMGELLDSEYVKDCDQSCYENRAKDYLATLGPFVDVFECGSEVNADPDDQWVGKNVWPKVRAALKLAKAQGKQTAVTFYLQPNLYMFKWIKDNIADEDKKLIDWALISFYTKDNNEWKPQSWPTLFETLGNLLPNSKLGMGEVGDDRSKDKATAEFKYYYKDFPVTHPRFIGFFGYWYQSQFIGPNAFLLDQLKAVVK